MVVVVFCFVVVIVVVIERPVKGEGHSEVKTLITWETDLPSMSYITLRLKKIEKNSAEQTERSEIWMTEFLVVGEAYKAIFTLLQA